MRLVPPWFDRSRQVESSPCAIWRAWWSGYLLNEEEVGLSLYPSGRGEREDQRHFFGRHRVSHSADLQVLVILARGISLNSL